MEIFYSFDLFLKAYYDFVGYVLRFFILKHVYRIMLIHSYLFTFS